jgi:hypothetical protein
MVAFLLTVPFPARSMGLSLRVTRIVSLKILLKAGASLFASSMSGLQEHLQVQQQHMISGNSPHSVPKLSKLFCVIDVNFIPCSWLYKDPNLIASTAEYDRAVYVGVGVDDTFHGSWYCLLPRREYQNVVDSSYAARKMSEKTNNANFSRTSSTNPLSSGA